MSFDNWNIRQLRENYPFLNKIWDLYDSFDKTVEDGGYKDVYKAFCDSVKVDLGEDKERYDRFCLKLMRNLDPYCKVKEKCTSYSDRCSNVNNWLYNTTEKKILNKHIIERFFDLSSTIRSEIENYGCPYYSYDTEYEEPINTIHLKIFTDNIDIIVRTLMSNGQPNNTLCKKYVCKCVNIYKRMNMLYCSGSNAHGKHQKTCDMLKALKFSYDMFLLGNPEIRPKIPSLEATKEDHLAICPSEEPQYSLQEGVEELSGSSTSSKISTTIGTMAGVSSVFALLYKLTPAGRWMNNGILGRGGRINNSLYTNGQDELIFDGLEHNNFNSYNIGYEAA